MDCCHNAQTLSTLVHCGKLNLQRYVDEIMRPTVLPFLGHIRQGALCQDDNARLIFFSNCEFCNYFYDYEWTIYKSFKNMFHDFLTEGKREINMVLPLLLQKCILVLYQLNR